MLRAKKWVAIGLVGLAAAAGATVLTVPSWKASPASGQSSRGGGFVAGASKVAIRDERTSRYIVVYREAALASYDGKIAGLPAPPALAARGRTGEAPKDRIDVKSKQARAYVAYLDRVQRQHEARIAGVLGRQLKVHRRMQHALNGEIVDLTASEAARVSKLAQVALVEEYREYQVDTDVGPALIGVDPVWNGTNPGSRLAVKGEGVVAGIIDTGINFGSPSFAAADPIDGYQHVNPLGSGNYLGTCQAGGPDAGRCNDKLIGGYDFVCNLQPDPTKPDTYCSLTATYREEPGFGDTNSHGSHTASTVAGNQRDAMFKGGNRRISGVAPRANVVAFDVCYTNVADGRGLCPNTASVAAVDQAVADGVVDVINFSIGGGVTPWSDAVSLAFLNAVDAGIYVATSAGNSGPGPNTMGHHEPWTASTAAAQHGRGDFQPLFQITGPGTVPAALTAILLNEGSGGVAQSAAIATGVTVSPGIDTANDGCAAYPANTFAGAIAVVRRGTCSFAIKANFARDAGAVAVIIANNQAGAVIPSVPGTTIPVFSAVQADANAIRDWAAANPTCSALIGYPPAPIPNVADALAAFSSRGPAANFDLIKPDVTAPGANILAVVSGTTVTGSENAVGLMSGTSMASPHNAGAAVLLRQLRPTWTVPEIKSALEMTATQTVYLEDQVTPANAFARGGGRVRVDMAARAGLVLHETKARFLAADPATGGDPAALNLPSMARGKCIDQCVFKRTVRNTLTFRQIWNASVQGLNGTVSPAQFTVRPGETKTLTITINSSALAQDGAWNFGNVVLQPASVGDPNQPVLRMPVAVAVPPPVITVGPDPFNANVTVGSNSVATLNVGNIGGARLDFTVDNTGNGIGTMFSAVHGSVASGFRSTSYTDPATAGVPGQYSGDDFTLPVPTRITSLYVEGFTISNAALATTATSLTWSIYPDSAGVPAGNPETAPGAAVWTYTASPLLGGVSTAGNNIGLNLDQVGQTVNLPAGKYWLVVHARTSFANRWVWYASETGNGTFMTITPAAGAWTSNNSFAGLSGRIQGEVACGAPWIGAATPTMGQLAGGANTNVQIQLGSSGLAAGAYTGFACVSSNDPARPKVANRVALNLVAP